MNTKRFLTSKLSLFLILVLFATSSCVNQRKATMLQEKQIKDLSQEIINKQATSYRVKSGDHLYIKIYSVDPKTSKFFQTDFPSLVNPTYVYLNSYKVDEEGNISFSFVDK